MEAPWPPAPLRWPEEPLTDGVVVLDRMGVGDLDAIVDGASDAETARYIPVPVPYDRPDAEEFLDLQDDAAAAGALLCFAVRRRGAPDLLGAIGATFAGRRGECEIGYWLRPSARGSGLSARAIVLLASHVFAQYPVHRCELLVHPANIASKRTCEAAGAVAEGLRRAASSAVRGSGFDPMLVYSLLPADLG
jgi:RimJ/RimL family protein N-acetyltransferase